MKRCTGCNVILANEEVNTCDVCITESFRNTCYKCNNGWGNCHCPDVKEDQGFEWCGMWIVNPVVSECGRFFVNPEIHYGEAYITWRNKNG